MQLIRIVMEIEVEDENADEIMEKITRDMVPTSYTVKGTTYPMLRTQVTVEKL